MWHSRSSICSRVGAVIIAAFLAIVCGAARADYETAVTTATNDQENPTISGDIIVWQDLRNDTGDYSNCDIYGRNLTGGGDFAITTAAKWQWEPAISGNIVVWTDERNDPGDFSEQDIYGYNLSTSTEFPICTAAGWQHTPAISGNIVVWIDERNIATTGADIYGYNLSTSTEFPICTAPGDQWLGGINGNIVVWEDWRDLLTTEVDIYGYNLSTSTEFPIAVRSGWQFAPDVYGNTVVWVDDRNFATTDDDIYGYDLGLSQEFPISLAVGAQEDPSIFGDIVAWEDWRNDPGDSSNVDIYGYDFGTSGEITISTAADSQRQPASNGTHVVWRDDRNLATSGYDIYMLLDSPFIKRTVNFPAAGLYQFSLPLKNPDRLDGRWVLRPLLSDDSKVIDHVVNSTTVQLATWSNSAAAYTYGTLDELADPDNSYFIDVSGACNITMIGSLFSLNVEVQSGWNMIGAATQSRDIRNILGSVTLTSGPWNWSDTANDYLSSYTLTPGKGYWMKTSNGGIIGSTSLAAGGFGLFSMAAPGGEKPTGEGPILMEFADVPAGHWAHEAVGALRWMGVTGGWARDLEMEGGSGGWWSGTGGQSLFYPRHGISRAQLAVFVARSFDIPLAEAGGKLFADVPAGLPAASHIEAVCELGIMGEYPRSPGRFAPRRAATRAEVAAALAQAAGLGNAPRIGRSRYRDISSRYWAATEINALAAAGAFAGDPRTGRYFRPNYKASRAQTALWIHNLLKDAD